MRTNKLLCSLEYGDYDYDESGTPIPHTSGPLPQGGAAASGGLQLTGLLCPQCRTLCHGVDALKDHMSKAHGMQQHTQPQKAPAQQQQQQQQPSKVGGSSKEASDALIICHICDKVIHSICFDSRNTLINLLLMCSMRV